MGDFFKIIKLFCGKSKELKSRQNLVSSFWSSVVILFLGLGFVSLIEGRAQIYYREKETQPGHNEIEEYEHNTKNNNGNLQGTPTPINANSFHIVTDCITITLEEGTFHYKSTGEIDSVCGLYLISDPDKNIRVTIDYIDAPCESGGLIGFVDGWELNGEVFPSLSDSEADPEFRFKEFCGRRRFRKTMVASQNAALIQYKLPKRGQGFSISVRHVPNPTPCNILVQDTEGIYELENFGNKKSNCSITTLFDAKITVHAMNVGVHPTHLYMPRSTGTGSHVNIYGHNGIMHKCHKHGLKDYLMIGGSSGLDNTNMIPVEDMCGTYFATPISNVIFCGMTSVKLVSSGKYRNKVTVEIKKAEIEDIEFASYICGL